MKIGGDESDKLAVRRDGGRSDVVGRLDRQIGRRIDGKSHGLLGNRGITAMRQQPDRLGGREEAQKNGDGQEAARARRLLGFLLLVEKLELATQIPGALPAERGMLRQAALDDAIERRRSQLPQRYQ